MAFLTMERLRQPVAAGGNGIGLFPRVTGLGDLPLIATRCNHGAPQRLHPRVRHVAAFSESAEASTDSLVRGPGYLEPRPGPGTNSTSSRRRWSLRLRMSAAITGFLSLFVRASSGGFSLQ
jgi:hypothetical protein